MQNKWKNAQSQDISNLRIYPLKHFVQIAIPKPHILRLLGQALKDTFEIKSDFFTSHYFNFWTWPGNTRMRKLPEPKWW